MPPRAVLGVSNMINTALRLFIAIAFADRLQKVNTSLLIAAAAALALIPDSKKK